MQYGETGKLIRGVGGLYEIALDAGDTPLSGRRISARAKGNFRHEGVTPLVGDRVRIAFDEAILTKNEQGELCPLGDGGGTVVCEGTPEEVAQVAESYTGQFLKKVL